MGNQITALTQAVAAAEIKVNELRDKEASLRRVISKWSDDIRQAGEILAGPYRYPAHGEAKSAHAAAFRGRSEASTALNGVQLDIGRVSTRLAELRRDLSRAQYDAVTDADLMRVQSDTLAAIRSIDSQLADLQRDWVTLVEKRDAALKVRQTVITAQGELTEAAQTLEAAQADAFIDGGKADIAGHSAKVTKARRKVEEAEVDAVAARAALPRIAERLENLQANIERVRAERVAAVSAYWGNRKTLLERQYLEQARGLMDCLQSLMAVDRLAGGDLGRQLFAKMERAVYIPVEGKHTEILNSTSWFGHEVIPDVSAALARLNDEFDTATGRQL